MRPHHPVANIDDMNGLLEQDISRSRAVPSPVTQPALVCRHTRAVWIGGRRSIVVRGDGRNLADLARMNPSHNFYKWRSAPNLETDIDAHLTVDPLANLERALSLCHINSHGLLAIGMLAGTCYSVKVLNVKPRRGRDLYGIHVWRCGKLLEGRVATKHQLRIDSGMPQRCIDFVEMRLCLSKLIGKDIGQGDDSRTRILGK